MSIRKTRKFTNVNIRLVRKFKGRDKYPIYTEKQSSVVLEEIHRALRISSERECLLQKSSDSMLAADSAVTPMYGVRSVRQAIHGNCSC